MTPAARLSAAIDVVAEIETRRRPAADVLKDWGFAHRFAGSSDRAAIAGLVYDALRRKASSAWLMGEATPRATLIGMLRRERGLPTGEIAALCSGARFAPAPLTEAELGALERGTFAGAPARSGRARDARTSTRSGASTRSTASRSPSTRSAAGIAPSSTRSTSPRRTIPRPEAPVA